MSATINAANFLMLSVFGIAAVGYLLGRITIKGISLGTAGVFVIALIYGAFSGTHFNSKFVIEEINYASQALKIIENLGLVFFVTSVGFIAGPNFFKNMKHNFKSYVLLGVVITFMRRRFCGVQAFSVSYRSRSSRFMMASSCSRICAFMGPSSR